MLGRDLFDHVVAVFAYEDGYVFFLGGVGDYLKLLDFLFLSGEVHSDSLDEFAPVNGFSGEEAMCIVMWLFKE